MQPRQLIPWVLSPTSVCPDTTIHISLPGLQHSNAYRYLSPDGENVCKPLLAADLQSPQLEELRDLGQQCYSSCLHCLSMYNDVDVGALVGSSLSSKQAHFTGDASQWHDLVTECAIFQNLPEYYSCFLSFGACAQTLIQCPDH